MATLESIEGIGPANAKKLRAAGVKSTASLLKSGGTKKGRKEIAAASGINEKSVLEWVNRADLMRVRGVSTQYSDLLESAGVDTVKELAKRRPDNLTAKMKEMNDAAMAKGHSIVRRPPSQLEVEKWVAHAKTLNPAVTY